MVVPATKPIETALMILKITRRRDIFLIFCTMPKSDANAKI